MISARTRLRVAAVVSMVMGAFVVFFAVGANAATINGTATITTPSNGQLISPATSTTVFALSLPAGASCSGSTTNGGYQVYTYLVPQGTDIQTLTASQGSLSDYGLFDSTGTLVGPFNVPSNDVVSTLPNDLEWGSAVTSDSLLEALLAAPGGVWEAGVACANASGSVTDYWDVDITFAASGSDPDGFVWYVGAISTTTTTTTTTTTSTDPSSTTTSTDPSSTTTSSTSSTSTSTSTTAASGATSTTSTTSGTAIPLSASSSGGVDGTSGGTGSSSTGSGSTGGALAFTGMPTSVVKMLGVGLLGIGLGLMFLASDRRRRPRSIAAPSRTLW